jgi:thioesterase domain-containing protein
MRRCYQCGGEFGLLRHVFVRGEFCSKRCSEAYKQNEAYRQDWERQRRADNQVNILTPNGELDRTALPPPVVQLQEGKAETPLYFLGAEPPEFRLAQLMGPGHSIFGVEVPWPLAWRNAAANNETSNLPTMEQLVAPAVAALSAHSRSSPCVLAGYSFGGLIAFEAAHQLRAQGIKVEMVILLDSQTKYPPPHRVAWEKLRNDWKRSPKGRSTDRTSQSIGSRLRGSWPIIRWMLVKEIKRLGRYFLQAVLRDPGQITSKRDEQGKPLHFGLILRVWLNAAESYRLRPLDCRGVLFRADPKEEAPARALDGSLGWNGLFSRGLEIISIPGDHITILRHEQHSLTLARKMNELLNRFCIKPTKELV